MNYKDTEFGKKYASYHCNGILQTWDDDMKFLSEKSMIELNDLIQEFLNTKAKFQKTD